MTYLLILLSALLLVSGQFMWKAAVANVTVWHVDTMFKVITSYYFLGGALLYVIATLVWMVVLSRLPLSMAYPFQSISYIIAMLASFFIFKETVVPIQWVGAVVIIIGVIMVSR